MWELNPRPNSTDFEHFQPENRRSLVTWPDMPARVSALVKSWMPLFFDLRMSIYDFWIAERDALILVNSKSNRRSQQP
jgi:hypothetical protein